MDDELKSILSGTLHTLQNIPENQRTWETVMKTVRQNSLLETHQGEVAYDKSLVKGGHHTFKFNGSPEPATIKEVRVLLLWQSLTHDRTHR